MYPYIKIRWGREKTKTNWLGERKFYIEQAMYEADYCTSQKLEREKKNMSRVSAAQGEVIISARCCAIETRVMHPLPPVGLSRAAR